MHDPSCGPDFIFMLTRNDRTIADADARLETALAAGVRHIGFKDVGLDAATLIRLIAGIRAAGAVSYLEVVAPDRNDELRSVEAGVRFGVDNILGGRHVALALPRLAGCDIGYYPFVGNVHGHPSILTGGAGELASSALDITRFRGVTGINLLAWRSSGDVAGLIAAVCKASPKPVIIAGSIDRPAQIALLRSAGAAAFTVGTAALDGRFPARSKRLRDQLEAILASSRGLIEIPSADP